jgi:hypothetical protein
MGSYEAMRRINPLGLAVGVGQIIAPPGIQPASSSGYDLWDQLIEQLQLPTVGVYTPWAAREGLDWDVVRQPPETNIIVAGLNDDTWRGAQTLAMGASLPWIGILANQTPSTQEVMEALRGTPYEFFHTQAVYSQADAGDPPTIQFLHWARLRDPGDEHSGTSSLTQMATNLGGQLVFAAQVNYDTSAVRTPPQMPFEEALAAQFPGQVTPPGGELPPPNGGEPPPGYQPPGPPPVEPYKAYIIPIAATGVAFAIAGYFAARAIKKRKGVR